MALLMGGGALVHLNVLNQAVNRTVCSGALLRNCARRYKPLRTLTRAPFRRLPWRYGHRNHVRSVCLSSA